MKKTFSKTEIVRNYAKKFTKTPSRSLARKIFNENKEHFKDLEEIRDTLRRIRGVRGKENIKDVALHIKPFTFANPFKLPKSYAEKPKVFTFPKECNNILVLSDLHIPFHDITALTVAINYGLEKNINTIFINGDLLDFYQISRFVNVERKRSVPQELKAAREVLQILTDTFPMVPMYFLKGN